MSTESYRAENTALLEALMDMVLQHCCSPVDDLIRHRYISSNEAAVAILEKALDGNEVALLQRVPIHRPFFHRAAGMEIPLEEAVVATGYP